MLLILSNGHGEDLMAGQLAAKIRELAPEIPQASLSVVGEGKPLIAAGVPQIFPGKSFPSGGFVRSGLKYLLADIRAGFWQHWRGQAKALRENAGQIKLTLAVGDSLLLYLSRRHLHKPLVFVPTAKSDYIQPHFPFEVRWMKETATVVFPRDAKTAESLKAQGVPAKFVGNLMMDSIDQHGYDLGLAGYGLQTGGPPVIAILPGSRDEAYLNFPLLARSAQVYGEVYGPAVFPVALAGSIDDGKLGAWLYKEGWQEGSANEPGVIAVFQKSQAKLLLCKGAFGDILHKADLVLGLAGTANEQAVGLGKPVITFTGLGSQFTPKFVAAQKRLLGEAVTVVYGEDRNKPPTSKSVADQAQAILNNPERRAEIARVGRERMGAPGGVEAVVKHTIEIYSTV